jgi:hypothetical protein
MDRNKRKDLLDIIISTSVGRLTNRLKCCCQLSCWSAPLLVRRPNKGRKFKLPMDRNKRKDLLDIIIAAIASEGFGSKKYGTAFWAQMQSAYTKLLTEANKTDGKVSSDVGSKNVLKEELTEVLDSFIYLIKANYRKNWEAELRN